MIKVNIHSDKMAVVRFNHKVDCDKFAALMIDTKKSPDFSVDIKIRDERE